jgi:A/G-specific adenine glycosylase
MDFTSRLLIWYHENKRELPWRTNHDPYKIWLSEIILQQTRVIQGIKYYDRFLENFPDIFKLAEASEDQVLAIWQGLGYYSRARNLHFTAKYIVENFHGQFPGSYEGLLKLKGIGKYTAAAIASIAFGIKVPAIDGNVNRVISRFFGLEKPLDEPATQNQIAQIALELMDDSDPGIFNQALMDFGSLVCKPTNPLCDLCPFFHDCIARIEEKQGQIPVKQKKATSRVRHFHFLFFYYRGENGLNFFVEKRIGNDIWKNLYQIPLIEKNGEDITPGELYGHELFTEDELITKNIKVNFNVMKISHKLTHQDIKAYFHSLLLDKDISKSFVRRFKWVAMDHFENIGKPVLISKFIDKYVKNIINRNA